MEARLHERIIGQEEAIHAISDAIRRARSGLKDPHARLVRSSSLVRRASGKTELAKALAWFMFDDEEALVRIDMSEYREQHTVSRLFGAPPGYVGYEEGGQLTEAVRRRPYRVILFDEIEKAHPGSLECVAANPGRWSSDRWSGQHRGLPQHGSDHDLEPGH